MDKRIVTDEQELQLWRQASEVVSRARRGAISFDLASSRLQAIIEGNTETALPAEKRGKKRDLAEEERVWWQTWLAKLGFTGIKVPKPAVSNREMSRLKKNASGLIYVPATSREFYERFMRAVGQGNHWTVANADREGIVWDDKPTGGYWLKVDFASECPRLGTPWNILQNQIRLLTLPEYAIAWHALKVCDQMLDIRTWSWLATRYKFSDGRIGALNANESVGQVCVNGFGPEGLERSYAGEGGRAAEVVPNAA